MHILIIPSWYPDERIENDSYGIFIKELAEAYAQEGHNVSVLAHFITLSLNPKRFFDFFKRKNYLKINGVKTFNVKYINWSGKISKNNKSLIKAALNWFTYYTKKYGYPDIIHAHATFNAGIIALSIKEQFNIPYVITEHSTQVMKGLHGREKIILNKVFSNSKYYTAVGNNLLQKLVESYNTNPNIGKVIPNILDKRFYEKKQSNLTKNKFIFLNIALDGYKKRRDILIKAFSIAFTETAMVELWIAGTVKENPAIIAQSKKLEILNKVKLLGLLGREQVHQAIANSNVFVLSSDVETFGIVLIEALSQGKPVISTDSGGPKDIITDFNGLFVPTGDVYELAQAMKKIMKDYQNYNQKLIRKDCLNKYSHQKIVNQYIRLFKQ